MARELLVCIFTKCVVDVVVFVVVFVCCCCCCLCGCSCGLGYGLLRNNKIIIS